MELLLCNKCKYESSCKFRYARYTNNTIVAACTTEDSKRKEFITQSLITPREMDRRDIFHQHMKILEQDKEG